jgi:hypothetical protein
MVLEWTKGSWWRLILPAFFLLLQKGQFFCSEGSWWILLRWWIYRRIELRRSLLTTPHLTAIPLSEQLVNSKLSHQVSDGLLQRQSLLLQLAGVWYLFGEDLAEGSKQQSWLQRRLVV